MKLVKIDLSNVQAIVGLNVRDDQQSFVASNRDSLVEAYATLASGRVALPFGLYDGDIPVGFVMIGYDVLDDGDPQIARGNYCLWRLMIDARYQGRGLGRQAVQAAMDYIRTMPCGPAEKCWLSYEPENTVARRLYEQFGFRETGEMDGEEIVAAVDL